MTEVVAHFTVEISGTQWVLVPDEARFGRHFVPKSWREGLRNMMRVEVARVGNQIVRIDPLPENATPKPRTRQQAPSPGQRPARPSTPAHTAAPAQARQGAARSPAQNARPQRRAQPAGGGGPASGYFVNPYNFVPFSTELRKRDGLADGPPIGHDRWHEGRYIARLCVEFTTVTPLLTMEITGKDQSKPAVYSVRRDPDGNPIVSGASIKGMLRSAYEQATGSRLGVFSHDEKLSVRNGRSRTTFDTAPAGLLPIVLKPASTAGDLSAADRVFGWVAAKANDTSGGVRGQLRMGGVSVVTPSVVRPNAKGTTWELATLNSPKPSNARFYTRDANGAPLHGTPKANGYQASHRLAGHKVYPHQEREADYWELEHGGWESQGSADKKPHPVDKAGHYRNFLAAPESAPDVSIAIRDWVEPGVTFQTTLYAENLTEDELAALLWVITLGDGNEALYHRLGMGKPLGFGSISARIRWDQSSLLNHNSVRQRYEDPDHTPEDIPTAEDSGTALVKRFVRAFREAAPATYLSIVAAARGTSLPVHYPRLGTGPGEVEPQTETYQWFVENDKSAHKHALPLLTPTPGVPVEDLPTVPRAPRRQC